MKALPTKQTTATHAPGDDPPVADEPIPNLLLRNTRKQSGWTQQEVAEKIKVAAVSVGRWERGEVVPNRYDRELLCGLFHRSAEELGFAGGKETPVSADSQEPEQAPPEVRLSNRRPFHEQLMYERRLRGWSQEALADAIGGSPKTLGRWEQGTGLPSSYYQQRLVELFGKNAEELGLLEKAQPQVTSRPYRMRRTLHVDVPVHCGDCERPEITALLETIVIDPSKGCTTFYFRFTNRTAEDAGLKFESLSLTEPSGDFFLGRSVGSFLLGAGQSIPLSVVFDWIPQRKLLYRLNLVLIRPDRWRNTYRPIPLTV
jgi:transcriptional regulator with XRE-family HTH domain